MSKILLMYIFNINLVSRTYFVVVSLLEYEGIADGIVGDENVKIIMLSITILWALLLALVLWISFFNWQKNTQLLKMGWKEHLGLMSRIKHHNNSNHNNDIPIKQPWTLRYGKIMANTKYLILFALIYWLCFVAIALLSALSLHYFIMYSKSV